MIYIIGSGFSGLTTAYALLKKNKDITIITPTKIIKKNKNFSIFKYILKKNGEIKNSPKEIIDTINFIEKISYDNCKYISSHYDGGLSNVWGGVLSDIKNYNLEKFPFSYNAINNLHKKFRVLEKIIFNKNFNMSNIKKNSKENITWIKLNQNKTNTTNLKKYLLNQGVKFKYGLYLKKILFKKKNMLLYDLRKKKDFTLPYKKIYLSSGPFNTAKIILNSFEEYKMIKLYETRHFYCLIKKNDTYKDQYFKFNYNNVEFYCQLYNFNKIFNIFFKKKFKNFNLFNGYYIGQCYLNVKNSGYIKVKKDKNNKFLIKGFNDNFIKSKIKSTFKKYNNKNSNIKFYFPILNTPGASNHIGSSFPMSKKSTKWNTRLNGQLSKYKDIHLSDSSVLNQIDMQPITLFTIFNILRMNN